LVTAILGLGLLLSAPAEAQSGVGLGIVLGDPSGITLKLPLSGSSAVDFVLGVDTNNGIGDDDAQFHVDWLYSPAVLGRGPGFTVPFYFGIGGVIEFDDDGFDDDFDIGARVPIGIAFEFQSVPLELFLEFGMEVLFINDDGDDLDFDGMLGLRFYF
jgi:hypothetical protein